MHGGGRDACKFYHKTIRRSALHSLDYAKLLYRV